MADETMTAPATATRSAGFMTRAKRGLKGLTTKDGLVGDYDYAFLFRPNIPYILPRTRRSAPFFGLNDKMPLFLALLLGFQHSLSMLAGIITPPIIISGQGGVALGIADTQYLVSTALIVSGILSSLQITRFHIYKTSYYFGTGLISVVGTSFSIIPVATGAFSQMYASGYCPRSSDGTKLPCPKGYGALLGTAALCSLLEMGLSFTKPSVLKRVFPPLVTGPTVTLIGVALIGESGFKNWAGSAAEPGCIDRPSSGKYSVCPSLGSPHALPWGSAEYIGLGFSVFITIIICERFGSPIMKSTSVIIGLLIGCIIAAATGYFSDTGIKSAKVASFIWVKTYPLSIYAPMILPLMMVYIVLMMEAIGDITATCDVSKLEVEGTLFNSRIQGGVLADGFNGLLASLCTITPVSVFAQNNGVIALTRCANRKAGYCACFFLLIMGIFSKFAAAIVSIPNSVLGGLTTFLFAAVAVSGIRIISTVPFTRRNRFILTASLAIGLGAILVPEWFSYVFTYSGNNMTLKGFMNAIVLVMESGFAVAGFIALILNLILPEEDEDETMSITANEADQRMDQQEWDEIKHKNNQGSAGKSSDEELAVKKE